MGLTSGGFSDEANSHYSGCRVPRPFIDNSSGMSGYDTVMNGLTVPLTCSVTVAPGVPVDLEIAVADTSDGQYDTAVALTDGGIWST